MEILVTGGCGFLGRNVIPDLCRSGHHVSCLDRYEADFLRENQVRFIAGDISERNLMDRSLEGIDAVIHMACSILPQMSNVDPYFDLVSNEMWTRISIWSPTSEAPFSCWMPASGTRCGR